MYQYVNKFNVATNQDKSEVVIRFLQESPKFENVNIDNDNKTTLSDICATPVSEIVVTGAFAKEMARIINSILED